MWPDPQETADLVIFTEESLKGKLHFLCSVWLSKVHSEMIPSNEDSSAEAKGPGKTLVKCCVS